MILADVATLVIKINIHFACGLLTPRLRKVQVPDAVFSIAASGRNFEVRYVRIL
jgi:hypothetical protein